jgi:hypothetical protein
MTCSPLDSTTPDSSYEGIAGKRSVGQVNSSRVIAAAYTRTRTSPSRGSGRATSSSLSPSSYNRTAFIAFDLQELAE